MKTFDDKKYELFPKREGDDRSNHGNRQLIGSIGLVMPLLLWLFAGWRPTVAQPWHVLSSISAYYYSGAVSAFAGMLVALALFLLSYKGYENKYYRRDRVAAIVAGCAALLVALFPTEAPDPSLVLPWWTPPMGFIHFASAAVLFGSFIFFALFQFPKFSGKKTKSLKWDKKVRNVIYRSCGVAMLICILWIIYALNTGAPIFLPEALALEFFAISWLVKGRVQVTAAAVGRRSLYYATHPRQFVSDAGHAVRPQQVVQPKAPRKRA